MRDPKPNSRLRGLMAAGTLSLFVLGGAIPVRAAHGDEAHLVKDINTTVDAETGGTASSYPSEMTVAGNQAFFSALGVGGRELYRTNGTSSGTVRLSIRPGARGAFPAEMRALGAKVVFTANDGVTGRELWITDGTPTGTTRVKDIRPGATGSEPRGLAVMGARLYFSANDGVRGRELWVTDGTAGGTHIVRDIKPGATGSDPRELVAVGARLFFYAHASQTLWVSDGTGPGTVAFPNSANLGDVRQLTRVGSQLFFVGTTYIDIFTSETSLRVVRSGANRSVKLLDATWENCPQAGYCHETLDMIPVGSLLFVTGPTRRLWRTDGTIAGTIKLKNLNDCGAKPGRYWECVYAGAFTDVAGSLYFVLPQYYYSAEDSEYRNESDQVWTSDGTVAGTRLVKTFHQSSTGGWNAPGASISLDGIFYFTAYEFPSGFELWRSDGTDAGTTLVHDINTLGHGPGTEDFDNGWAFPSHMTAFAGSLLMTADDGSHGAEVWRVVP